MDNSFHEVCKSEEILEGAAKLVTVEEKQIIIARDGGILYGISAYCTHDGGLLDAEEVVDNEIECPRHGARFSLQTGEVTMMPAVYGLATYTVKESDGKVLVLLD